LFFGFFNQDHPIDLRSLALVVGFHVAAGLFRFQAAGSKWMTTR